jgi:hypothetical protein
MWFLLSRSYRSFLELDGVRLLVRLMILEVEERVVEIEHQQVLAGPRRVHDVDFCLLDHRLELLLVF